MSGSPAAGQHAVDAMTAAFVRLARALLGGTHLPDPVAVRTSAFLARTAVERHVSVVLEQRLPGAQEGTMRAQLLCLRSLDPRHGENAAHLHGELSRACHHHPYELGPSVDEAAGLLDRVEALTGHRG